MKKIKEFCKNYKKEIMVAGCVVGAVVCGMIIKKNLFKKDMIDMTGKSYISWKGDNGFMNLDRVKEILDSNSGNSETFAVVKDGAAGTDMYKCILISDDVVHPTTWFE